MSTSSLWQSSWRGRRQSYKFSSTSYENQINTLLIYYLIFNCNFCSQCVICVPFFCESQPILSPLVFGLQAPIHFSSVCVGWTRRCEFLKRIVFMLYRRLMWSWKHYTAPKGKRLSFRHTKIILFYATSLTTLGNLRREKREQHGQQLDNSCHMGVLSPLPITLQFLPLLQNVQGCNITQKQDSSYCKYSAWKQKQVLEIQG